MTNARPRGLRIWYSFILSSFPNSIYLSCIILHFPLPLATHSGSKTWRKRVGDINEGSSYSQLEEEMNTGAWVRICKPFFKGGPGPDSQPGGPVPQPYLSCLPTRLHRLAESISRNLFLGSLNVYKYGRRVLTYNQTPSFQLSVYNNCVLILSTFSVVSSS